MISATSARSGVLRNVMETYSAQMVRVAGALLFGIWLTRLLAPTARGYYGVALTLATLATQFGQGGSIPPIPILPPAIRVFAEPCWETVLYSP